MTVNAKTGRTPFRVGLTGGIASGKSTVANMFAGLGAVVIDTDVIAREVVAPGQPALDEIAQTFGESVLTAAGGLDRVAMRQLVFSDDDARKRLEAIVHPRIQEETRRQSAQAGGIYQIIAIPLLVESTLKSFVDRILVVDCDEETQIRRLLEVSDDIDAVTLWTGAQQDELAEATVTGTVGPALWTLDAASDVQGADFLARTLWEERHGNQRRTA